MFDSAIYVYGRVEPVCRCYLFFKQQQSLPNDICVGLVWTCLILCFGPKAWCLREQPTFAVTVSFGYLFPTHSPKLRFGLSWSVH